MNLNELDPFSPAFLDDPYPSFAQLRREAPVHFVEKRNMWILAKHDDVVAAAKNHAVFSSTGGVGYDWNQRPMMPMYDPPEHSRVRRMVAKHFTPVTLTTMKPRVQALVDEIVDHVLEAGEIDVVQDIALPLSLGTLAILLGVPPRYRRELRRWSRGTVADLAGGLEGVEARQVDELRREFNVFLASLIEERREDLEHHRHAIDVITALVAASDDERLTRPELIAFCVLLLVAGYETTLNGISNGILALLTHPEECRKLRANRALVPGAIEEMIRFDAPVLSMFRNTLTDATVSGVTIPKGSKVMLAFASGNHDEAKYVDAGQFRVERAPTEHLGFGAGVHYCLGVALARIELSSLANTLLDRIATIEQRGPVTRTASVLFRGVKEFPVKVSASATSATVKRPQVAKASEQSPMSSNPTPFRLEVSDEVLRDLKDRLARTRWPDQVERSGWDYGTELGYLQSLSKYWRDEYDWRTHERRINELPCFTTRVDDLDIHFVHARSARRASAFPLLLLHGWPGPFTLFSRVIEPLIAPPDDADAFDVVVASLPGYPFSSAARERGMGAMKMADVFAKLMDGLGYERYGVVGEDLGAGVASRMALVHAGAVAGLHLNMPCENPPRDQMGGDLTAEEQAWLKDFLRFREKELSHVAIHSTRPQSLGYGLNDSPTALLGWLVEKYRAWSDCEGDVERRFSKDDLITNAMLYWVTNTASSSIRMYFESRQLPWFLGKGERIEVPTAIALCKREFLQPPRRWIERVYNLQRLTHIPSGGHFSSWEEPAAMSDDIRAFFRGLR